MARSKLIWVVLTMQKYVMFLLKVKGKPTTKSMTGGLNVTDQVTAIWTVIA